MEKSKALQKLLDSYDLSLNAASVFNALTKAGIMREVEYESTTGSGATKAFKELTGQGLEFGENVQTQHEFKTEPRFYESKLPKLLAVATRQLAKEVSELVKATPKVSAPKPDTGDPWRDIMGVDMAKHRKPKRADDDRVDRVVQSREIVLRWDTTDD